MGFGGLFKINLQKQLRYVGLAVLGFCVVAMTNNNAEAAGGSWGSSLGGFASRGGLGSGGGLLGGRAPVRNLLGRLNSRVANIGGGSRGGLLSGGGCQGGLLGGGLLGGGSLGGGSLGGGLIGNGPILGGSRGGLLGTGLLAGRVFNGSQGGLLGIRNGGSVGGSFGRYHGVSAGSYSYSSVGSSHVPTYAPTIAAPSYLAAVPAPAPVATSYALPSYDLSSYDIPSYDYSTFSVASPLSSYVMEQSYPVGDYGFEPGYPVQQYSTPLDMGYPIGGGFDGGFPLSGTNYGGGFGDGFPVEGSIIGSEFGGGGLSVDPLNSTTILDGGSIDSMLDTSGMPLNDGLQLNVPTPAGGGGNEYYDGLGPGDGSQPPAGDSGLPGPADDGTYFERSPIETKAVLNLILPKEAKVLINGKVTTTRGARRSYVSSHLTDDREYKYQVKAIVMRDGEETVRTQMVTMRPGVDQTVKLDFDDTVTTLALKVPADAKVKLCGKPTEQTGSLRSYTTNSLADGKTWKSYKVSVEYMVGGEKRVEERTLDLKAGKQHELAIGIDTTDSQIAAK